MSGSVFSVLTSYDDNDETLHYDRVRIHHREWFRLVHSNAVDAVESFRIYRLNSIREYFTMVVYESSISEVTRSSVPSDRHQLLFAESLKLL